MADKSQKKQKTTDNSEKDEKAELQRDQGIYSDENARHPQQEPE